MSAVYRSAPAALHPVTVPAGRARSVCSEPASRADSTAASTACSSWCSTSARMSTISRSPPGRLSTPQMDRAGWDSSCVHNAAPPRSTPSTRKWCFSTAWCAGLFRERTDLRENTNGGSRSISPRLSLPLLPRRPRARRWLHVAQIWMKNLYRNGLSSARKSAVSEFERRQLSSDVFLVTYLLDQSGRWSRRAAIWRWDSGNWLDRVPSSDAGCRLTIRSSRRCLVARFWTLR